VNEKCEGRENNDKRLRAFFALSLIPSSSSSSLKGGDVNDTA